MKDIIQNQPKSWLSKPFILNNTNQVLSKTSY